MTAPGAVRIVPRREAAFSLGLHLFKEMTFQERMLDGYGYNPDFPEPELRIEKVHSGKRPRVQFRLSDLVRPAHAKYQESLSQSQPFSLKNALQR